MQRFMAMLLVCLGFYSALPAAADEPTKVGLTLTKSDAKRPEQKLGEELLKLIRQQVQSDRSLKLVEHRQVDVNLAQRLLDRSQAEALKKQFGKLLSADYFLMLETLPAEADDQPPSVRLRVVDAGTSAVRGVLAASLERDTLRRTADEFVAFAQSVTSAPEQATVTVAVAPFDSQGHFDRLRPMELKIRDLITARLISLSGGATGGRSQKFQILQRSNLGELIHERELTRSGLTDKSDAPAANAATYLIRGQIDERLAGDEHVLLVKGEMVDVGTARPVEKLEFECGAKELEKQLLASVDRLAARLTREDRPLAAPAGISDLEAESLMEAALADLKKLSRPDFANSSIQFRVQTGTRNSGGPSVIATGSPLGRSMLLKSIDRLELVLLHHPDDPLAAYCLAFCYSSHQEGVYQPERADELFRKVVALDPESELAALSLLYLPQISQDDRTGYVGRREQGDASEQEAWRREACERFRFAFEHMPEKYRDIYEWPDLLFRANHLLSGPDELEQRAYLMQQAIDQLDKCPGRTRLPLATAVAGIAESLATAQRDAEFQAKEEKLLRGWVGGDDLALVEAGAGGLAQFLVQAKRPLEAAEILTESARKLSSLDTPTDRLAQSRLLLMASRDYRDGHKPGKALELMQSNEMQRLIDPARSPMEWVVGGREFEIGCCYQKMKQPAPALEAFLRALDNSENSELVERIRAIGGIPLRPDRDVNVHYYPLPTKNGSAQAVYQSCLATDEKEIYVGSSLGLQVFDAKAKKWKAALKSEPIHCLKYADGQLWAGTEAAGLWRNNRKQGKWTQIAKGKLPDPHVESLVLVGRDVYAGFGKPPTGGLVRIDEHEQVTAFTQPEAPTIAPTHLVLTPDGLLARTDKAVYSFDLKSNWTSTVASPLQPRLFAGRDCVWASNWFQELTRWGDSAAKNERFKSAWGVRDKYNRGSRDARFVAEHAGQVWFGGFPTARIKSSGLYRFDLKTGECHEFTPADGFKMCYEHVVHDGLWLDDRLWLATNQGLCLVTPLGKEEKAEPPAEDAAPEDDEVAVQ